MFHPPSSPGNLSLRKASDPILSGKQSRTPFTGTAVGQLCSLPSSRPLRQRRLLSPFPTGNRKLSLARAGAWSRSQRACAPSRSQRLAAAPQPWPWPRTRLHHMRERATDDRRREGRAADPWGSRGLRRLSLFCARGYPAARVPPRLPPPECPRVWESSWGSHRNFRDK